MAKKLNKRELQAIADTKLPGQKLVEATVTVRFLTKEDLEYAWNELKAHLDQFASLRRCGGHIDIKFVDLPPKKI